MKHWHYARSKVDSSNLRSMSLFIPVYGTALNLFFDFGPVLVYV